MIQKNYCINCGHGHVSMCSKCNEEHGPDTKCKGKQFALNCSLHKKEWDCKCTEKTFIPRKFKGKFFLKFFSEFSRSEKYFEGLKNYL